MNRQRGVLIAGNWKMNHGVRATREFFAGLRSRADRSLDTRVRVCLIPPTLSLEQAKSETLSLRFPVTIGAQNAHWETKGAFTGELSGEMLKEAGIDWVLIGHSERRQLFGETDQTVRKRTESLLSQGFHVILCVGETRAEREAGQTRAVLTRQLGEVFPSADQGAARFLDGKLIIAYEPVWAIGTGLNATPEQAEEAHQTIRGFLETRIGKNAAAQTSLLYGGSVTPENIDTLLSCPNVDGALVGGASLKPDSFYALIKSAEKSLA